MARNPRRTRRDPASETPSWWDHLTDRTRHLICLLVLLIVSVGFFAPMHFSSKRLIGSDTVSWREKAEVMKEYQQETGNTPLWNPNIFAGMPGFNNPSPVPQLDDIPRLLRKVVWPTSHFIFLLAGTYLLVFFLTGNFLAGVLAACGYGLTTYLPILLQVGHNTKFIALCFAPWLALAFAYALRRPRLLAALFFAAALALNLRAKHVQITYYMTFLLGVWWLVEGMLAVRRSQLKRFGKVTGWLALGSLLGVLMVAQPYLGNAEYKQYSTRGTGGPSKEESGLEIDYAMRWSQGAGELVTLAVAGAYGGSSRERTYWGPKPFTEGPHYVGIIVLLLAGLALWRLRRRAVWAFGAGALLMTLFALGRHLRFVNDLMYAYFPLFNSFRAPETWLSVVAFALAVLAGLGAYYLACREPDAEAEQRKSRTVYIALGVAGGFVGLLLIFQDVFFDFEKPNERQQVARQYVQQVLQQRPELRSQQSRVRQAVRQQVNRYMQKVKQKRTDAFTGDAWRTLLFLVLAGAVLVAYRRRAVPAWLMQSALVLLIVLDLGGVGRRYLNGDDLQEVPNIEAMIASYDFDRYLEQEVEASGGPGRFRVLSLESGNPFTNARPSYYYQSLGGYHGAKLQLFQDFIDHIYRNPQTGVPNENALDLLGTRYVVAPQRLPGYEVAYRSEQTRMLVLRNPDAVPRAFLVGQTETIDAPQKMWQRLRSEQFDPQQTALLAEPISGFETTPIDSGSTVEVTLEDFSLHEITWNVRTDAPRLLVASEIYYPAGWSAYLDGEKVPIHRADYLLRAVAVPDGEHQLVMRFEPQSRIWGLWLSWIATILTYGGILVLLGTSFWRHRRARKAEAPEEETTAAS